MITLIYHSTACVPCSTDERILFLQDIRLKNICLNVTGILLYHDRKIMQIFEGEKAVVNDLFERIKKDTRHTDVIKLIDFKIKKRSYGDWSMAFRNLSDKGWLTIEGYLNLDDKQSVLEHATNKTAYLEMIINSFIEEDVHN